ALFVDMPWDVKAYASRSRRFPSDSTLRQLFDDEQFEAYRALGAAAATQAIQGFAEHLETCPEPSCVAFHEYLPASESDIRKLRRRLVTRVARLVNQLSIE